MAILEAASEEDEEDRTPSAMPKDGDDSATLRPKAKTPLELALEVINEIVDIVMETEDANTD